MPKHQYGIIGWPVEHSVSPQMQLAAFHALGISAEYNRIPVKPEELPEKIQELKRIGYLGWNVTVPHKAAIIPLLDEIETNAEVSGSVNTVINRNGSLFGYSTDGYGLEISIKESFNIDLAGGSFLFWGAGGAAVAASTHFVNTGARQIILVNRTVEKALHLKKTLNKINPESEIKVYIPADVDSLQQIFSNIDVIIQSTSIGLKANDPVSINRELLSPSLKIVDMIYSETALIREMKTIGGTIIDGKGMLLHQGAKSFSLWTGKDAPVEVMRKALK